MKQQLYSFYLILLVFGISSASAQHLSTLKTPVFRKDSISIVKTGAVSNGVSLNTSAIANAIHLLSSRGGGVVLIPRGVWLTGPITLKSNINLHLAEGALLIFSPDPDQYPFVS